MQVFAGSEWNKTLRKREDHYIMLASAFQIVMHGSAFQHSWCVVPHSTGLWWFFFFSFSNKPKWWWDSPMQFMRTLVSLIISIELAGFLRYLKQMTFWMPVCSQIIRKFPFSLLLFCCCIFNGNNFKKKSTFSLMFLENMEIKEAEGNS